MLIGIDASRANKNKKTGVEWYSYHLIEQFKKIDKKNRFFLYTNEPLKGDLAKCPLNFEEKVLNWPLSRFWTMGRLTWEMLSAKEKPDLLFVPSHTLPLAKPDKAVVTILDIGFEHFPDFYHWADKSYHKLAIKIIKRKADKIITVSQYSKKDISNVYNLDMEKIKVVYNGYDKETYHLIKDFEPKIKEPYILFIGRLELKKNIPRLVKAFARLKQQNPQLKHKLVLIGSKGLTFNLVEKQIKKYQLDEQIIFPGWVKDEELPVWLNGADLFAFPSIFEGFGIPVLEAMACGCPVVCSDSTSLPEAAGRATLMFDPRNVEQMTEQMKKVLTDAYIKAELVKKGLERVKNFSWKKCADQTLEVLENT